MSSFYFLLPTLLAVLISFLFVRASAIALMMTGMDKRRARFQALSAFSGTGFTTKEAEIVIHHPVRRKIVTWLMIMGNAGIVTVIVTATSSMATSHGYQLPINVFVIVIGVYIIYRVATHKGFLKRWDRFIERKLIKSPTFDEAPAEDLLHFLEGYGLIRRVIPETSPLAGRSLEECRVSEQGLLVLGIERGKKWIPTPKASEKLEVGDGMVVYGPLKVLKDLLKGELKFKSGE